MGRLLFDKVDAFLKKKNYILTHVYTSSGGECIFLQCRTPRHGKTLLVRVPSKYTLKIDGVPDGTPSTNISIIDKQNSRQRDYMERIREGIDSQIELIAISSTSLTLLRGDDVMVYHIGDLEIEKEDDEDEADEVTLLEQAIDKLVGEDDHSTGVGEDIEEEGSTTAGRDEDDALVFDETPISDVIVNDGSESVTSVNEDDNVEEPELQLTDKEIEIGLIYICIDLPSFFKTSSSLENSLIEIYRKMDEREALQRNERLHHIEGLAARVHGKVSSRLLAITEDEKKLRSQLARLTSVLNKTEKLRDKTTSIDRLKEFANPVDEVYNRTTRTIHDLNIQLLKYRDEVDRLLTSYESAFVDLLP